MGEFEGYLKGGDVRSLGEVEEEDEKKEKEEGKRGEENGEKVGMRDGL